MHDRNEGLGMFRATLVGIVLFPYLLGITMLEAISWWKYNKIHKEGSKGIGRLISCKRKYTGHHSFFVPHYEPVVEFYIGEKRYELQAMGNFLLRPPGKEGEEISIIFLNKYSDKVVIEREKNIKESYPISFFFHLLACVAIILLIMSAVQTYRI